jgi:hypothetical protein
MTQLRKAVLTECLPDGQAPAYFYYEDEPGRRSVAKLLTRGRGHATDSVRNSLRQERKAK